MMKENSKIAKNHKSNGANPKNKRIFDYDQNRNLNDISNIAKNKISGGHAKNKASYESSGYQKVKQLKSPMNLESDRIEVLGGGDISDTGAG